MSLTIPAPVAPTAGAEPTRLPIFVYGTLRSGQGNYAWALDGRTERERRAVLPQAAMFGTVGFPFVTLDPTGDGHVVGDLMDVPAEHYSEVMRDLDALEGYRGAGVSGNLYDRILVEVEVDGGERVQAHTYVASARSGRFLDGLPRIPSGDWVEHVERASAQV